MGISSRVLDEFYSYSNLTKPIISGIQSKCEAIDQFARYSNQPQPNICRMAFDATSFKCNCQFRFKHGKHDGQRQISFHSRISIGGNLWKDWTNWKLQMKQLMKEGGKITSSKHFQPKNRELEFLLKWGKTKLHLWRTIHADQTTALVNSRRVKDMALVNLSGNMIILKKDSSKMVSDREKGCVWASEEHYDGGRETGSQTWLW